MAPLVSLAMPVRNGARFIERAIASVQAQSLTDFELVIVDNASTDATQAICERFARDDPRIRYLRNPADIGAGANFNRGAELASGAYFKWCAHDDLIDPGYLAGCVAALTADPAAVIAYGAFINTVIDFVIVAFCIFILVKIMNRLRRPAEAGPATTKECPLCLSTIPIKATRCAHCTSEVQ